jgi:predicted amidophosphoribosyltransferase
MTALTLPEVPAKQHQRVRRSRHFPRLCGTCGAPMASQEDSCWSCGAIWDDGSNTAEQVRVTTARDQ